jgi:undecaprenyl-diphosphatase
MSIDIEVNNFLSSIQTQVSVQIFSAINFSLYILLLVTLVYLAYKKDKQNSIKFVAGSLILYCILEVLKIVTARPRPNALTNDSFPSRHTAMAFFATYFFKTDKKIQILLYIWATLIALSRLILNLHWLSDVLVGSIIGYLFAYLIGKIPLEHLLKRNLLH